MPDAYLGDHIHSIVQGIQLELQSGRTRCDRPCSGFIFIAGRPKAALR